MKFTSVESKVYNARRVTRPYIIRVLVYFIYTLYVYALCYNVITETCIQGVRNCDVVKSIILYI